VRWIDCRKNGIKWSFRTEQGDVRINEYTIIIIIIIIITTTIIIITITITTTN